MCSMCSWISTFCEDLLEFYTLIFCHVFICSKGCSRERLFFFVLWLELGFVKVRLVVAVCHAIIEVNVGVKESVMSKRVLRSTDACMNSVSVLLCLFMCRRPDPPMNSFSLYLPCRWRTERVREVCLNN